MKMYLCADCFPIMAELYPDGKLIKLSMSMKIEKCGHCRKKIRHLDEYELKILKREGADERK